MTLVRDRGGGARRSDAERWRLELEDGTPLFTDLQLARALIEALWRKRPVDLAVRAWQEYLSPARNRSPTS